MQLCEHLSFTLIDVNIICYVSILPAKGKT